MRFLQLQYKFRELVNFNKAKTELGVDKIQIFIAESLVKYAEKYILSVLKIFRSVMTDKLGYIVPNIRVTDNPQLEDNLVKVLINGISVSEFKMTADEAGVRVFSENLTNIFIKHADEILRNDDVEKYIKILKEDYKNEYNYLIKHIGSVRRVLANLLKENISVKNIVKIAELICYYGFEKYSADEISELIRIDNCVKRYIKDTYAQDNEITAHELSDEMMKAVKTAVQYKQELEIIEKIKQYLNPEADNTIICEKSARLKLFKIIQDVFPKTNIIAYEELLKTIKIKQKGLIS